MRRLSGHRMNRLLPVPHRVSRGSGRRCLAGCQITEVTAGPISFAEPHGEFPITADEPSEMEAGYTRSHAAVRRRVAVRIGIGETPMKTKRWRVILAALAITSSAAPGLAAADGPNAGGVTAAAIPAAVTSLQKQQRSPGDACALTEIAANPPRPAWDYGASTTQCGVAEADSGWMKQAMGSGVRQQLFASSLRYGLTPKLDLRWGSKNHIAQSGGGMASLEGIRDQWANVRYRFLEQGHWTPATGLLYGIKIPTANPGGGSARAIPTSSTFLSPAATWARTPWTSIPWEL